jgi:cbb3-type cytochrome oxidase maturation protein
LTWIKASTVAIGSAAAAFAILNRYFDRAAEPAPLEIGGKPNYNMGPVKFSTVMAMFWGIAGFTVGLCNGQYNDVEGAALRVLSDDDLQ